MSIREPKVIDPPNFDAHKIWDDCKDAMDNVVRPDGSLSWKAAFCADPGCCTCPNCHVYYWQLGKVIECLDCQFQFPTDWWPMYAYGCNAATGSRVKSLHNERMSHPYYRYGFEHSVDDPWEHHDKIDWKSVMNPVCNVADSEVNHGGR